MTKIIAELCQNHNGNEKILEKMISSAYKNGADYVKIQALYSNQLQFRERFEETNQKFSMYRPYLNEKERLLKLDLRFESEKLFVEICEDYKIDPMITIFTNMGAERAANAGFKHIKIASYDSNNFQLIHKALEFANFLFISTGATTVSEIQLLSIFLSENNFRNIKVELLHCKTEYPNLERRVHLNRMSWLKSFSYSVGFSDHTRTYNEFGGKEESINLASKVAISLGASVIERHFSILSPELTKDGRISIQPEDLFELRRFINLSQRAKEFELQTNSDIVKSIIGSDNTNYEPSVEEWWNRDYYRGRVID
jgi:sialic acid synthase SpsE